MHAYGTSTKTKIQGQETRSHIPFITYSYICKVKLNLSLCFNCAPRLEGVLGEWKYSSMYSWSWH
jgi:hypothetical protein